MGRSYNFKCSSCDFQCETSGQRDQGKRSYVYDTYNCFNCKRTFEHIVKKIPGYYIEVPIQRSFWQKIFSSEQLYERRFVEMKISDYEINCYYCNSNNVASWKLTCPKCESKMLKGNIVAFWD